jgi:hypothetical protein
MSQILGPACVSDQVEISGKPWRPIAQRREGSGLMLGAAMCRGMTWRDGPDTDISDENTVSFFLSLIATCYCMS